MATQRTAVSDRVKRAARSSNPRRLDPAVRRSSARRSTLRNSAVRGSTVRSSAIRSSAVPPSSVGLSTAGRSSTGDRSLRRSSSRSAAGRPDAVHFGRFGERVAADWYRNNGYQVLAANWRCRQGELDLIVTREDAVIFVEVKARSSSRFGSGAEAVDWRKQQKVRAVALRWLADQPDHFGDLRFDVVDVDRRGTVQVHAGCF